ncbi:DNA-binding protein [Candidatus Shapirobacteria bacterium CG10_big_fil_rev_8_21_14_0_10_40_9]|uniref:DNA-binding protein n=1 Tax=Candidatus Shapirobacteria bacterium CG10_big_fil_rev_8_21_14_0_10_40_9 TaxID=1974888 RepID=A0A2M8L4D4_9BACT|nr:MAG: DNA-binding protein [Candidatus Shapirobacteria bacterium CG10_big_fil_rev_8_21_14_0_10_40_9]
MRKSELVEIIARKAHLTKKASSEAIGAFLSEIQKALVKGEKVILSGFGTFRVVTVKNKAVIVPKTGEKKIVKSHRAPRFSPGRSLRKIIKG